MTWYLCFYGLVNGVLWVGVRSYAPSSAKGNDDDETVFMSWLTVFVSCRTVFASWQLFLQFGKMFLAVNKLFW